MKKTNWLCRRHALAYSRIMMIRLFKTVPFKKNAVALQGRLPRAAEKNLPSCSASATAGAEQRLKVAILSDALSAFLPVAYHPSTVTLFGWVLPLSCCYRLVFSNRCH